SIDVTWKDVQKALPEKSCAIEFIQYEKGGRQKMGALVLNRKGKPEFVQMPDPDEIYGRKVGGRTVSDRLYNVRGTLKNAVYYDTDGLGKMLWNDAILKAIGNASDVYFSPDGYLHQIALEYMLPSGVADIRAHRLTGTRMLLQHSVSGPFSKVLFIGDADYSGKGFNVSGDNDRQAYDYVKRMNCHFRPLAASKAEIDSIAAIWGSSDNVVLVDDDATEYAFRNLCSKSDLLHISAHGLFGASSVPQGTDLKPCAADSTLSQSVLAFSGTQAAMDSDSYDISLLDGLLSAKEISSLDLSGARLVVLACCETGLGYVTSDGVYGIQRGLKNAGAGAMIVSLWDVDDKATGIFMTALHRGLKNGMSIYDAFMAARSGFDSEIASDGSLKFNGCTLTCEYQNAGGYGEPRYKDAFILIDAVN
ncbi:MAG: CHAT domain-containing protein, partial [Candidatus Cryptobacteroides sp.]